MSYDLLGRIGELLVDDERVIGEVRFAHESHHERKDLGSELPAQDRKFIRLANDRSSMKAHAFDAEAAEAGVEFVRQRADGVRLVVKDQSEKVETRRDVRLVQNPGFVNENAQHTLVQSAPSENISDGNRFSSLKAKNILRFSVIPSYRKTSPLIIANFDRVGKWGNENADRRFQK